MSDTDELLQEVDEITGTESTGPEQSEFDADADPATGQAGRGGGLRSRAAGRAASVFAPKAFLVAAALAAGGMFAAGAIPILSSLPVVGRAVGLLGVFLGTMVYGAVSSERRYSESAVAGGVVAGLAAFQGMLLLTITGLGVPIVALLAGLGAVAGVAGHYFGRDLRAGLTGDLSGDPGP